MFQVLSAPRIPSLLFFLSAVGLTTATLARSATGQDAEPSCCSSIEQKLKGPLPMDRKSVKLRETLGHLVNSTAPFLGEQRLQQLDRQIAGFPEGIDPKVLREALSVRGNERLECGRIDEAIDDLTRAVDLAKAGDDVRMVAATLNDLGIAWMRRGERNNCVSRHNQDSCLCPLKDGAIHVDKAPSRQAIKCFLAALKAEPRNSVAMWLLNLTTMTVGNWPDGVPEKWRIPANAFASEREMKRMYDIAPKLGLNTADRAGGAIWDDFTGDGLLDLVTSSMDLHQHLRFFQQKPDKTFVEVSEEKGLAGQLGGLEIFHFDANNDGRLDLLVQRGGWMGRWGEIANSLLIQQEDGTFVDRTLEAGIEIEAPSQTAGMADVDNDGDVDLFLGYEGFQGMYDSKMFRNRGDGTFEDVTKIAGVASAGFVKGCSFGDYDEDGLPDLYVSTMNGPNHLYHNDGGFKFHDVAKELGVTEPKDSFSSFFFDYDNDGHLDLYASDYDHNARAASVGLWYLRGMRVCDTNHLYRNDGHGKFEDVTKAVNLDRVAFPMGSNFGDIDGDGYPEIYLSTGSPEFSSLMPNLMYHNDHGARFEDVTAATDTGSLQKGHMVSFADWDDDGDQDLFVQLGGAFPDDGFPDALYENPGYGSRWLTVRLVGRQSNRFGLGARIRARIAEPTTGERNVFAFVGTNSSFGGNSYQEEMGLGQAEKLVELEVYWPTSKLTQTFHDVPLDRTIVVVEGAEKPEVLPRRGETW